MVPLSRREEQVLLAVWQLKDNAYLVSIKNHLSKLTKTKWSLSAAQKPILQLEKKGFIETFIGKSTPIRGGRRKKICRITDMGITALKALKKEQDILWREFLEMEFDSLR
jgi:DNA-binding PadR family transcriptional regulator